MVRALFVTASLRPYGGAEHHSLALMNRLLERGHTCQAVFVKGTGRSLDGIHLHDRATVRCLDAARYLDLRAVADLAAHIAAFKPSIILAANPYPLMYATLAQMRSRASPRLVVTYHSTRLPNIKERLQTVVYRPFFWHADCAVFVCEQQRRYWLRRAVFSRRNEVIHNGVDVDAFRDRSTVEERATLRRELGWSEADYVIGASAWLRPEKNHVQLLDAVARLRQMGIPARALMIGDGEMRGFLEARAHGLGLGNHVVITGAQRDVRRYVAICDVMVLCSVAVETFSLAALEAMALARPVVHSDLGGASEMIFPGRNGFLFPVGDTEAFVDRLATLSDRAIARRMGEQARLVVEKLFSEDAMVDRYESLLLGPSSGVLSKRGDAREIERA